jgi:cytochrome b pre-mRNA-processing protein 3
VTFFTRLFGGKRERQQLDPLYRAVVQAGRDPAWYRDGSVPDTVEGRFDMIAALLSLVLLRLEADGEPSRRPSVLLAELFVDDMDGNLRQAGIGDLMVGKHIGRLMGALGGRVGAFRDCLARGGNFEPAVTRNIFHEAPPSREALSFVSGKLEGFHRALAATPSADLLAGRIPTP